MAVGTVANNAVDSAGVAQVHATSQLKASSNTDAGVVENDDETPVPTDKGIPRMTPDMLKECCIKNQGWSAPDLNEVIMLQYKGFRKIENLQPYVNAKTIWLECNGISRVEGLETMSGLLSLYLQSNCISRMANLDGMTSLQYLNLAHNSISKVEGLENLRCLETINLSANKLMDVASLQGFLERRTTLKSVDMSHNYIEDGDAYLDFWEKALPDAHCLYLHHNPCSRNLKDYRRRLVSNLELLRWIDERPVDEQERVGAEAWAIGGKEAENEAKKNHILQGREAKATSFKNYQRMAHAAAARLRAQNDLKAAHAAAHEEVAVELEQTGALAEGWVASAARSSATSSRAIDEPSQQSQLHAKVQAFLDSRPTPADATEAPAHTADAEASVTKEAAELMESTSQAADDVRNQVETVESLPEQVREIEWTDFQEKRLGRLTAECHYDFQKVALRLSEEFSCVVDTQACRLQYRKLLKPRGDADLKADAGRACDAPDVDPKKLQEVSKWWIRQVSMNQHSREARPKPPRNSSNDDDLSDELTSVHASVEAACADRTCISLGGAGQHLADVHRYDDFAKFVPPPRTAEEVESCVVSGAGAASVKIALAQQSELFELD